LTATAACAENFLSGVSLRRTRYNVKFSLCNKNDRKEYKVSKYNTKTLSSSHELIFKRHVDVSPLLKSRVRQHATDRARELFKPSKDAERFVVSIFKNWEVLDLSFLRVTL